MKNKQRRDRPSGPGATELLQELILGPSGSPGEVQELLCRIIVSPAQPVSTVRQTGVSLASTLEHKQRRWTGDGEEEEEEKQWFSLPGLVLPEAADALNTVQLQMQ